MKWTKQSLEAFEDMVATMFEQGQFNCPIHLCGGNEDNLLSIFEYIKPEDYVISTHRNHYHYLLKGGDKDRLIAELKGSVDGICAGKARSMNICDPSINFYTTAIVAGGCAIGCGIALGLKKEKSTAHVYCFVGDGAEDSGHFMEAVRFGFSRKLPITFIIEDNDFSVDATKKARWVRHQEIKNDNVIRYYYQRTYPHVGIGKHVSF